MIEYGKYHTLEGTYPHIGHHIGLLADGNIHNIKLIYKYISNNDDPVKTMLTFCGVYHGNEVIGICFFMLFFLTVKCQRKFYSKLNFPKTDVW